MTYLAPEMEPKCVPRMPDAQVLEVTARGARLRLLHLGSLELVQALTEAYSHYILAPYISPHPQV